MESKQKFVLAAFVAISLVANLILAIVIGSQLSVRPKDVQKDVVEVRNMLANNLHRMEERVAKLESELVRLKALSSWRWTSIDMRNWVEEANRGREEAEKLPPPTPIARDDE